MMWIGLGVLTGPWRTVQLYDALWTWIPALVLFALGILLYFKAGAHFSLAQLGGLPEVRRNHRDDRLVTTGIRARVRHPVYLGHLCEMVAWSLGTGLLVCWVLTGFAVLTGAVMIRVEDAELEKRFGEEYREYKSRVPAVLPKPHSTHDVRPRLSCDGICIRYELPGGGAHEIAVTDLTCLAEYNNTSGPWGDDYFLVFAVRGGLYYEISLYSDGRDKALQTLGETLGCELELGLVQSTSLATRIIWPKELEGHPLFIGKAINPEVTRLADSRQI